MSKAHLKFIAALPLIIILSLQTFSFAHPGRTDANGGHFDRSTGEYHYHTKSTTSQTSSENTNQNNTENNTTEQKDTTSSEIIVVDNKPKQVQAGVIQETNRETTNVPIKETSEIKIVENQNGDTYIYIPKKHFYSNINTVIYIILIIFAILGLISISPVIYMLLKKLENKRDSLSILLHIPYLIFWLPSYLGNLLYKLQKYLRENLDEFDEYEEDDF